MLVQNLDLPLNCWTTLALFLTLYFLIDRLEDNGNNKHISRLLEIHV